MANLKDIADAASDEILSQLPDEAIDELAKYENMTEEQYSEVKAILARYGVDIDAVAAAKRKEMQ